MLKFLPFLGILLVLGCQIAYKPVILSKHFADSSTPIIPNYSQTSNWASLPQFHDPADSIPLHSGLQNNQATATTDVFFIYPTLYTHAPESDSVWNASVHNTKLNHTIDFSTILFQASVFNGSCRIYSPRYRQAHLYAFYSLDTPDSQQSLALAYSDIRSAFQYYLENYNNGRPIIIAGHSQGSFLGVRLLQEFFDEKPLQKQLVAAYLPGMIIGKGIRTSDFKAIKLCNNPSETGCVATWHTYARDFFPNDFEKMRKGATGINPITFLANDDYVPASMNKGTLGTKFELQPHIFDAQQHQGMTWVSKPKVPGGFLLNTKSWHRADFNLFYLNIRENIAQRIDAFSEK